MKMLLTTCAMLFIKAMFLPNVDLLAWMSIAMVVDFATGVIKSVILKVPRTSKGYRETLSKFLQYAGAIIASFILSNGITKTNLINADNHSAIMHYMNDSLIIYIIYIEITSVFENLYACDQQTKFARFVITPVLRLLTLQFKGVPPIPEKIS
jgi:phosphate starvation-inducible membrane PsiE